MLLNTTVPVVQKTGPIPPIFSLRPHRFDAIRRNTRETGYVFGHMSFVLFSGYIPINRLFRTKQCIVALLLLCIFSILLVSEIKHKDEET
jgi:hypothetical protein